jgi:hypothetical protein
VRVKALKARNSAAQGASPEDMDKKEKEPLPRKLPFERGNIDHAFAIYTFKIYP